MKKDDNTTTISIAIYMIIVLCILLFFIITIYIIPFYSPYYKPDYYDDIEFSYYELDLAQNESDFSYKIDIASRDGSKVLINNSKLEINELIEYDQNDSLFIGDYRITTEFIGQQRFYLDDYHDTYNVINISISVTYFDADEDEYLSKGDYFILKIKDMDRDGPINLSQYYYEEFDLYLFDEDDGIGSVTLNERPPSPYDPVVMSESVEAEGNLVCHFMLIIIIIILIAFQVYFLVKLNKNKKEKI
jgi:hypothetical protein